MYTSLLATVIHGVRSGMASIRLPLFDFTLGQNGERGSSSLEWRTSSADQQVSTLLYCMGVHDVVSSTNITEEERKVYAIVMGMQVFYF